MKKFVFAVLAVAVLAVSGLAVSCGGGGPSCKKVTCGPACKTDGTEICDLDSLTCKPLVLCSPACTGTDVCNYVKGTCGAPVAAVTCSPACASGETCYSGTCKTTAVCTPTCDLATKGEFCTY